MKVIHVLKRIETVDQDIRELKKLEKSLEKNKSFAGPIFMTIEKQINILLGERIKLLELEIKNPPESLKKEIEGEDTDDISPIAQSESKPKKKTEKAEKAPKAKKAKPEQKETKPLEVNDSDDDDFPMPMFTQDLIDKKIQQIKTEPAPAEKTAAPKEKPKEESKESDESVKLLDIALEKGTLDKKTIMQEKEKRRIRFFRDNFPGGEY